MKHLLKSAACFVLFGIFCAAMMNTDGFWSRLSCGAMLVSLLWSIVYFIRMARVR